jgi:hypothetical protein
MILIKKGMKIRFTVNDSQNNGKRFVNGTIGFIKDKVISNNKLVSVTVDINGAEHVITKAMVKIYRQVYNTETGHIETVEVASVIQFPFVACYASTVHKAQSLTLDNVVVDVGCWKDKHGLLYVALSRVRGLNNLFLNNPINPGKIGVDQSISDFYESMKPYICYVSNGDTGLGAFLESCGSSHNVNCPTSSFSDMLNVFLGSYIDLSKYLPFDDPSIVEVGPYTKFDKYGWPITS